jgi:ribose transport system permease protein
VTDDAARTGIPSASDGASDPGVAADPGPAQGPAPAAPAAAVLPDRRTTRLLRAIRGAGPIFAILIVLLVLIAIKNPNPNKAAVFLALLKAAAPLAVLAAGQLFVIVSGEFDLSVGSLITVMVTVAALMIDGDPGLSYPVIGVLLLIGIVVGLINGIVTTRLGVPSFIATLGMLLILSGGIFWWTGGAPRGSLPENFRAFGRANVDGVSIIGQVPVSVLILLGVGLVAYWLLHRTNFGQQLFATGGNPRAAELAGINVRGVRTAAFILSGISGVIAGILLGGFAGVSAQVGETYEFQAISAVVLGGAVLGGGRGTIPTTIAGALSLQALFTLLNLFGFPTPIRDAVQGVIIISAVAYASFRLRGAR